MYIEFVNGRIRKVCEVRLEAIKKHGKRNADLIFQRISEIRASENLKILRGVPSARCHSLVGNRKGQYAVDLVHPKRLIFLPLFDGDLFEEVLVTGARIIEIADYH